jgi:hypothetical protein
LVLTAAEFIHAYLRNEYIHMCKEYIHMYIMSAYMRTYVGTRPTKVIQTCVTR